LVSSKREGKGKIASVGGALKKEEKKGGGRSTGSAKKKKVKSQEGAPGGQQGVRTFSQQKNRAKPRSPIQLKPHRSTPNGQRRKGLLGAFAREGKPTKVKPQRFPGKNTDIKKKKQKEEKEQRERESDGKETNLVQKKEVATKPTRANGRENWGTKCNDLLVGGTPGEKAGAQKKPNSKSPC